MFCNQSRFHLPTRVINSEQFWALVRAPRTAQLVSEARAALANGNKALYDRKKKLLPLMVFIGTFEESEKDVENKKTGEKRTVKGCWRVQSHVCLNGLVVADYDHVIEADQTEGSSPKLGEVRRGLNAGNAGVQTTPTPPNSGGERLREIWAEAYDKLSDEDKARIVLVFVTPSGYGLKVVFTADVGIGNLIDNQLDFSAELGLQLDESCKDASRGAFMTTAEDIISINEEKLFTYEDKSFGEKYNDEYRSGHSQPTISGRILPLSRGSQRGSEQGNIEAVQTTPPSGHPSYLGGEKDTYHGVPYGKIVEAWLDGKKVEPGDRHRTSLCLADHLRYITDNDPVLIERILREVPFVADIVKERNEDVAATVKSAREYKMFKSMPKKLSEALAKAGVKEAVQTTPPDGTPPNLGGEKDTDIYAMLPLDKWAEELQEMAEYYPCMKELFMNVHPHKMPAVLFSSAALFGTLMTRAYYHFWYEPEIVRRLNYCIFIIGDPGAGKNVIEKFYFKIADPMI